MYTVSHVFGSFLLICMYSSFLVDGCKSPKGWKIVARLSGVHVPGVVYGFDCRFGCSSRG